MCFDKPPRFDLCCAGAGSSESNPRACTRRPLNSLAERQPSCSPKQTAGPVVDGGARDPPGQDRHALPRNGSALHLPPTWLWRARVGEAPPLGMQCCCRPVGNGRLLAIPVLTGKGGSHSATSAVWGEPSGYTNKVFRQTVAHPRRHQRRHMDLQKLAGEKAHADPPRGGDPDGRSNDTRDHSCRRQALGHRRKEESPLCLFGRRSRSHTCKGQSSSGLALRVRQVGRSRRARVSFGHRDSLPMAV